MLVLATSVLVELERELRADRVGAVRIFMGGNCADDVACSTVSVGELAVRGSELGVRVLLARVRKIQLSEAIAYLAGLLEKAWVAKGRRLGKNENWIAATALHYSATLVYSDGDFDRVDGLKRVRIAAHGRLGTGGKNR